MATNRKIVEIKKCVLQIEEESKTTYPFDQKVGAYQVEGKQMIITGACQLSIFNIKTGEKKIYEPKVYQSCMRPEEIMIKTMKLTFDEEKEILVIENEYDRDEIEISDKEIVVQPWTFQITKKGCQPCTNCGRCSW